MRVYFGAGLALAVLAAGAWRVQVHAQEGRKHSRSRQRREDMNRLREIAALLVAQSRLPMKDGKLDPYDLVRRGEIKPENYGLLRSSRFGGPSDGEIEGGDYTNFPWERCGAPRPKGGAPYPLLWDKRPDEDGCVLAALSDGSTHAWDREALERALAEAGGGR